MVIEKLKFEVPIKFQKEFIKKDDEIWTSLLYTLEGFKDKKVYINPDIPTEIIIVIQWESKETWKSISQEIIARTIKNFENEMLKVNMVVNKPTYVKVSYVDE